MRRETGIARREFARAVLAAGGRPTVQGEVMEPGFGRLRLVLDVVEAVERADHVAVRLQALAESPRLTPAWRDEFAGVGATAEEAIAEAVGAWVAGPLEVLREALSEPPAEHRFAFVQRTAAGERTWLAYEGPLQLTGPRAAQEALVALLQEHPVFPRLAQERVLPEFAAGRAHVLKLYAARLGGAPALAEVLVDGDPLPAGGPVVAGLAWPPHEGHRSLRQYVCLVPAPEVPA